MSIFRYFLINNLISHNRIIQWLVSVLLIGTVCSCSDSKNSKDSLTEGQIEYSATVLSTNHPMASLAPSSATVKFKGSKLELEMSSMGMFYTTFISDCDSNTLTQTVKFMDIKNVCIYRKKELDAENKNYELKLVETKETKIIAGYTCTKVIATMVRDPKISFDIYYTPQLGSLNSNALSPYKDIKGMLMEYQIKRLGLEMRFTATAVKKESIDNADFTVPVNFKAVTPTEMEKLFNDIQ